MYRPARIALMLFTAILMTVMEVLPHHHHGLVGQIFMGQCETEAPISANGEEGDGHGDEEACILHKMRHVAIVTSSHHHRVAPVLLSLPPSVAAACPEPCCHCIFYSPQFIFASPLLRGCAEAIIIPRAPPALFA